MEIIWSNIDYPCFNLGDECLLWRRREADRLRCTPLQCPPPNPVLIRFVQTILVKSRKLCLFPIFIGSLPLLQLILLASKPSFNGQSKSIACDRDCCDESAWVDPPDIICDNWDKNWGTIGFCWQANLNSTTNLKALHVIIEVKMCDNWVDPPRGHWPLLAVSWRRFRNLAKL